MPGCSATTVADDRGVPPERVRAHRLQQPRRRRSGGDDGDQLSLVGDVERIEPQHLAGAADLGADRDRRLVELDADARRRRQLVERAATARRASGRACSGSRGHASSIACDQAVQRRACRSPARSRTRSPRAPT